MTRHAVVLFNLGGPDSPEAVRGFLTNLFSDPAIIRLPWPLRPLLARYIARSRTPVVQKIYAELGGRSPLLPETRKQAAALDQALAEPGHTWRSFVVMRYWHPFADEIAREVADWKPDRIVLLPLYPQFSSATTQSSLADWHRAAGKIGLQAPTSALCCYPDEPGFVGAYTALLRKAVAEARAAGGQEPRILFSAHGLPKRIVTQGGDPYAWQVERGAEAIAVAAGLKPESWRVCYQSRVGRLEWLGPYAEAEIRQAGADRVPLGVLPLAFVSEHSETLVELDRDYARLAQESGVPVYVRVPALGDHPAFIAGLAGLARGALSRSGARPCSLTGGRLCPADRHACPAA